MFHFQHDREIFVSFRFVFVSTICLFQRHSMNSLQRLMNLFQWRFMNEFVHRFQWIRYNDIKNACVRFFTFSQSTSTKMNLLHTTIRKQMTWKNEKQQSMRICCTIKSIRFFRNFLSVVDASTFCFDSKFAINQNRSINKNWKNSNSKNLKQYTLAKSISFCYFCFCFCRAREIDRFIILICKCLLHSIEIKIFNKIFIFDRFAYIFCFRFAFLVFAFIFSRLSHLFWIFLFQSWSNWYLNHNQWIFSQCRSIKKEK